MGNRHAFAFVATQILAAAFCHATAQTAFQVQQVRASDGHYLDFFGFSLAMVGDRVLIGACSDLDISTVETGSAFVLERRTFALGNIRVRRWVQTAQLSAADGVFGDNFARSVALTEVNEAFVGAPGADAPIAESGAVYVFTLVGGVWMQSAKLVAGDGSESASFGFSAAVSGTTAVIGAPSDDALATDAGSAYVFEKLAGVWTQTAKLTASDVGPMQSFGSAVTILGTQAVIGSATDDEFGFRTGAVYVFNKINGLWTQTQKLTASDPTVRAVFGDALSLSNGVLVVGAPSDALLLNPGAAYVFELVGGAWTQVAKLTNYPERHFGCAVSAQPGRALIGAWFGGAEGGVAYLFERRNGTWLPTQRLRPHDHGQDDEFGTAAVLSRDGLWIGATESDNGAHGYIGQAYFFNNHP